MAGSRSGAAGAAAQAASDGGVGGSGGGIVGFDGIKGPGASLPSSSAAQRRGRRSSASTSSSSSAVPTAPLHKKVFRALLTDGHTYWDGVLLVSACQIGQIMLVLPRATYLAGVVPASLIAVATLVAGIWTIYVLLSLYLEYKKRMMERGEWYQEVVVEGEAEGTGKGEEEDFDFGATPSSSEAAAPAPPPPKGAAATAEPPPTLSRSVTKKRKRLKVTQYHDVAAELGGPWCRSLVVALTALTLFGVGVAQVLACSSNFYYISGKAATMATEKAARGDFFDAALVHARSKRDWALIWGLPMCLLLLVPSYRSSRLISVFAITGTTFTAWYVVAASAEEINRRRGDPSLPPLAPPNLYPKSPKAFFVGGSVVMSALGAHTICMEIFEMLRQPVRFTSAFVLAQGYVWTLTAPQALAANVAFSDRLAAVDTVYGVLPFPDWRMQASVWLMNAHQVLVFGFVLMPIFYYSERILGVHELRFGLRRAAARVPVVAAVMLVALAFPFYGGFNALFASVGVPSLSFAIPCYLYNRTYLFGSGGDGSGGAARRSLWSRAAAARAAAPHPPPRLFGLLSTDASWKLAFALNTVLGVCFAVAGTGFGVFYSVEDMVLQADKWGVFAKCYQCVLPKKAGSG